MAFKTKRKYQEENLQLLNRIKELEQLLCPAEQHDYIRTSRTTHILDAYGSATHDDRYICKRCLKTKIEVEFS